MPDAKMGGGQWEVQASSYGVSGRDEREYGQCYCNSTLWRQIGSPFVVGTAQHMDLSNQPHPEQSL